MWNLNYANRKCNEYEMQRVHMQHLERITNVKSSVDKTEPKKPTFLLYKSNRLPPEHRKFYQKNI